MHDAVYTKYIMFKKFQSAMQIVAMAETVIYINMDDSSENYWIRLLVREWAQFCIFVYIGWTFRSRDLAPRFSVMPTLKSKGELVVAPIYSIEMDAETFKDCTWHEWHIGVVVPLVVTEESAQFLQRKVSSLWIICIWCDRAKKEYLNCLKTSGHQSEKCRYFSNLYLECRMEKNLMARQDMSELGFLKESDKEASGEKVTERIGN